MHDADVRPLVLRLAQGRYPSARVLPEWWGVVRVSQADDVLALETEREDVPNPSPAVHATLHLLWRDELLALLEEAGAAQGIRSADKTRLFRRALEAFPADALRARVRQVLVSRADWR